MNLTETAACLRALKAFDPQTSITEDTAIAWQSVLAPYPPRQVMTAAMQLAERRRTSSGNRDTSALDVFDIKAEIKRMRADLVERIDTPTPNVDPADALAWAAELRELKRLILDGRISADDAHRYSLGGIRVTPGEPWRPALDAMPAPRPLPRFPTMREPERPTATQILAEQLPTGERRQQLHAATEVAAGVIRICHESPLR